MSLTECKSADDLAQTLFVEIVAPLATQRKSDGESSFFASAGDARLKSYFDAPSLAVMQPADFEFPGDGTPDGLIDALTEYWKSRGEDELVPLAPPLKEVAEALKSEIAVNDGRVDIMCYTMF